MGDMMAVSSERGTNTMKYQSIVFMQESEADEAIKIWEEQGNQALCDYLKQWDNGDNDGEVYEASPAGTTDYVYLIDGYQMVVNYRLPYVGLSRIIK